MRLDDKFRLEHGRVYLTGIQALVRLPIDQMRLDRRAGLNTGAFISGYEGSPLGGYDLALAKAKPILEEHQIHFVPGLNEDLAATAVLGSQMMHVMGSARVDGVVGIWYGKGPGVDRSGDILKHANLSGTGPNCAALVLAGDDHMSKSSTAPHQSELSFYNFGMPIFCPGSVPEILDFGLAAIALSRFSGAWVAMKLVTNVCDAGSTVTLTETAPFRIPANYEKRIDARLVIPHTLALEAEVHYRRLDAARQFARLNGVNRMCGATDSPVWLAIATAGKSYYDTMQAFGDMGIEAEDLASLGIRVAQFGMTYPLEPEFVSRLARDVETLLVIEEKRSFLELQLREMLYGAAHQPRILGKKDATGAPLFSSLLELEPERIVEVIAPMILARRLTASVASRLEKIQEVANRERQPITARTPSYCPGCPHNRSTVLFEGQLAGGGIGCHGMAAFFPHLRDGYKFLTHMGGEGAPWIGMTPFVERGHIFQNIGDGTYFHSGSLAVQACVAAGVNITFKILYNGAVAMTGGQDVHGALSVPELTRKLAAEGVKRIVIVTDDTSKYDAKTNLGPNCVVRDRDKLQGTLQELEQVKGVSVMIYDQQCAAEKRRLRSRGKIAEPTNRIVIHERVCEGCGDCVRQSGCVSLQPVQTQLGQKTRVHQASCNKDYSCLKGDCPSFVTVRIKDGTGLRRKGPVALPAIEVPLPRTVARIGSGYAILSPGIGGTGVVTVNALLATAAWIDGISAVTLDQTGLAQKGGAVVSSILLSEEPIAAAAKIGWAQADVLLGFDLLGAGAHENLKCADPERTVAIVNTAEVPTGGAIRGEIQLAGPQQVIGLIERYTRRDRNVFVDASRIAEGLFATHLPVNIFLLGVAFQSGAIPLTAGAIQQAIGLNRTDSARNLEAFQWGRKYYQDAAFVESQLVPHDSTAVPFDRYADLVAYQGERYAREYRAFVDKAAVRAPALADIVSRSLYKLMAYKDEYEVARLLTDPKFRAGLDTQWEQIESISYNLHPPMLRALGFQQKLSLGEWFTTPLRILAKLKFLRGTPFDVFGYSRSRREERDLIVWYRNLIEEVLTLVTKGQMSAALELAGLPDQIRGYEDVKRESVRQARALADEKIIRMRYCAGGGGGGGAPAGGAGPPSGAIAGSVDPR